MDEMLRHVEEHAPLEACGILAGKNDRVEKVIFVLTRHKVPHDT